MGKSRQGTNAKGRSKRNGRFVRLDYVMLNCPAGQSLKPGELAILVRVMQRYHGENNGRISLSSRDAGRLANVSKDTAAKHIRSLCNKGFMRVKTPSSFGRNAHTTSDDEHVVRVINISLSLNLLNLL